MKGLAQNNLSNTLKAHVQRGNHHRPGSKLVIYEHVRHVEKVELNQQSQTPPKGALSGAQDLMVISKTQRHADDLETGVMLAERLDLRSL